MADIGKVYEERNESGDKTRIRLLENQLENYSSLIDNYKECCESLQKQIYEYQIELNQAKKLEHRSQIYEEINNMQDAQKLEKCDDQKVELVEVLAKFKSLQIENAELTQQLEIQSKKAKKKLSVMGKREQEMADKIKAYEKKLEESEKTLKAKIQIMNSEMEMESSLVDRERDELVKALAKCESLQIDNDKLTQQLEIQSKDARKKLSVISKLKQEMSDMIKAYEKKLEESEETLKARIQMTNSEMEVESSLVDRERSRDELFKALAKCESLQIDNNKLTHQLEILSKDAKKKLSVMGKREQEMADMIKDYEKKLEESEKTLKAKIQITNSEMEMKSSLEDRERDELVKALAKCESLQIDNDKLAQQLEIQSKDARNKLSVISKREQDLSEKIKACEKKLEESEKTLKARIQIMNSEMDIETSLVEIYKGRCETLQQNIEQYHAKLEQAKMCDDNDAKHFREEVKNLQDILKLEQRANQKDKNKVTEMMENYAKLQEDYDTVTQQLEIISRTQTRRNEVLNTASMEDIDSLTAEIFELDKVIQNKMEEIYKLKEELAFLNTQLGSYKTDLEEAISTRNFAFTEIEKLEKELNRYRNHNLDFSSSVKTNSHSYKHDNIESKEYTCPICDMMFPNLEKVEIHIDQEHKD